MPDQLPLSGYTIIEHVTADAGEVTDRAIAIAGRIAADLGATVLRVLPATGDPLAQAAPFIADPTGARRSATHVFLNGGKVALADSIADMPAADAILYPADALLTGALARIPVKVAVSSGMAGHLGIAERDVTDTSLLALSGLLDIVGDPEQAPTPFGGKQAAGVAGLAAFSGLVAALAMGGPETVRIAALEACLWSNWKSFAEKLYLGRGPTRQGRHAEWQAIECADGFAPLIFLEKDWPAVCRLIGETRLQLAPFDTQAGRRANMAALYDIVRPWYRTRTRAEIYALAKEHGLPIAPVLSVNELVADRQYEAQRFFAQPAAGAELPSAARVPTIPTTWNGQRFAPHDVSRTSARAANAEKPSATPRTRPLDGVRVLDLGIITAGASTSAMLADLGADVVKLEAPSYIDPFRVWDRGLGAPDWWNQSRFFKFTNRSKRGVALDLKSREGKELFLELVAKSDVLVENFRRGVLERLGLGADVLMAANPRLVVCSITSQGAHGPDAGAATYGSTLEATSGLADLTRAADGRPLVSGILVNYPDQIVSIYAAGIVCAAVMEQRRTGKGTRLDVSQRELASFLIGEHILAATAGTSMSTVAKPECDIARDAHGRWCVKLRGDTTVPVRTPDDLLAAFEAGETPNAFARAPDGTVAKGMPFAFDGAPLTITRPSPGLGEHNSEVLRDLLGLDAGRIEALGRSGIIGTVPKT